MHVSNNIVYKSDFVGVSKKYCLPSAALTDVTGEIKIRTKYREKEKGIMMPLLLDVIYIYQLPSLLKLSFQKVI